MTSHAELEKGIISSTAHNNKGLRLLPERLHQWWNNILVLLRPVSFITLHYIYFIATCLVASLVFWGSSTPVQSVRYIDALFFAVSAMTEAGLNTVNLSELNTWQQVMLFLLIIIGSTIFVSCIVLRVRKQAFEQRLQELADRRQKRLSRTKSFISLIKASSRRHVPRSDGGLEAAIASGAVRGQAIHEPTPARDPDMAQHSTKNDDDDDGGGGDENSKDEDTVDLKDGGRTEPQHSPDAPPSVSPRAVNISITFADGVRGPPVTQLRSRRLSNTGVGAHAPGAHPETALPFEDTNTSDVDAVDSIKLGTQADTSRLDKYINTLRGYVGRNSQFHQLTDKERRVLGGIEYDALCLLNWVVPLYLVLFQLFGALGCGAWMWVNQSDEARQNGLNPFWTGAFFAISAFNNSGMALLDANATVFQTSYYMLLTLGLLILAGNTCFPVFLRLILWTLKCCIPADTGSKRWSRWRCVLAFILDHPRRVYTNLFPSQATWWLAATLVCLNGIDWLAFELLNFGNPILETIQPKYRALDGLFQAFAVRSGGFYVVPISGLYPGTLIMYVLMMYLSAFPVTMSIRNTNVYEERSLAIFSEDPSPEALVNKEQPKSLSRARTVLDLARRVTQSQQHGLKSISRMSTTTNHDSGPQPTWSSVDFLRLQLRSQLGHDLWLIAFAIFLIAIIETHAIRTDPVNFSIFNILFEVVSGYATVGISIGVPWNAYSFSGAWHTGSKLILCAVMLRGRHRGLPVAIDRAILLPDKSLAWAEEEDGRLKRSRTLPSNAISPRTPIKWTTPLSASRMPDEFAGEHIA